MGEVGGGGGVGAGEAGGLMGLGSEPDPVLCVLWGWLAYRLWSHSNTYRYAVWCTGECNAAMANKNVQNKQALRTQRR